MKTILKTSVLSVVLVLIASVGFAQSTEPCHGPVREPYKVALENSYIIKMVKAGLGDAILVTEIEKYNCHFDFSADAIIQLNQNGVSNTVIKAMLLRDTSRTDTPQPIPQVGLAVPIVLPPKLIYKVEPEYTEEARAAKLQGKVVVAFTIEPNGIPTNFAIKQGLGGGLDEAAIGALMKWRFTPASKDGVPIAENVNMVEFSFPQNQPQASKAERVVNSVAGAVNGVLLQHYCPGIYRTPMMFMNASQYQMLQQCNANGYMLFGVYLYMPHR